MNFDFLSNLKSNIFQDTQKFVIHKYVYYNF